MSRRFPDDRQYRLSSRSPGTPGLITDHFADKPESGDEYVLMLEYPREL